MEVEFQTLEYWLIYTMLAENIAECYICTDDISAELMLNICLRAELGGCEENNWTRLSVSRSKYNSHNRKRRNITWAGVNAKITTENEQKVLKHALLICTKYYVTDQCSY